MIELSDRPADMLVRKLRKESCDPDLSPEHSVDEPRR